MPELNLDKDGFLLDADGNQLKVNDEPVKVPNATPKDQVESVIKERLARQSDRIKALEAQANKTPELEKVLEDLRKEKASIEEQLSTATQTAQDEVASQMATLKKAADETKAALEQERHGRVRDQVTNAILGKAGDRFINPADDVVPKLLGVHKREPVKDDQGKTVDGKFVDLFEMSFKNDKGDTVTELLPVEKALEIMASDERFGHYVRPTNAGGSGGGARYSNVQNLKRSEMNAAQKAEFVGKHGVEAFQTLPA